MKITSPEISDFSPLKWLVGENHGKPIFRQGCIFFYICSTIFWSGFTQFDSECEATFMAFNSSAELTDHHRLGSLPHNSTEHYSKPRLIDYYDYTGVYYPIVWGFMVYVLNFC